MEDLNVDRTASYGVAVQTRGVGLQGDLDGAGDDAAATCLFATGCTRGCPYFDEDADSGGLLREAVMCAPFYKNYTTALIWAFVLVMVGAIAWLGGMAAHELQHQTPPAAVVKRQDDSAEYYATGRFPPFEPCQNIEDAKPLSV
jgi:hypothetical protein